MARQTEDEKLRDDMGQYAVALDKPCVCGHRKGEHAAGSKGRSVGYCLAESGCDCEAFRAARKKRST